MPDIKQANIRRVTINLGLCKQCGICIYACPKKVFAGEPGEFPQVSGPEKCVQCLLCFYRCPDFAVEVEVDES